MAKTVEAAEQQARAIAAFDADLVEWRADGLAVPLPSATLAIIADDLREIVAPKPLMFTWRTSNEGGQAAPGADDAYADITAAVIRAKTADLVDVEVRHEAATGLLAIAKECGVPVIGSWHDIQTTPDADTIVAALQQAEAMGADVAKVAVTPQDATDVATVLTATARAAATVTIPLLTVAMGDIGQVSRVFGHVFGSQATFATAGQASAPGQPDISALRELWDISSRTGSGTDQGLVRRERR